MGQLGTANPAKHAGKRRSHVKTGCQTCKLRRIKCDETRPACLKCVHTSRVCSGYGIWGGGSADVSAHNRPTEWRRSAFSQLYCSHPDSLASKSAEERQLFGFFCWCPSLKISGVHKSEFWDRLLIQSSSVEPSIFHAAVAIGSVYRAYLDRIPWADRNGGLSSERPPRHTLSQSQTRVAMQQYNKAIRHLGDLLGADDLRSLRVAAMTCLLFVCLEMMLSRQQAMESHYRYAVVLLDEVQRRQGQAPASHGDLTKQGLSVADEDLCRAFARLTLQLNLLGQRATDLARKCPYSAFAYDPAAIPVPAVLADVPAARRSVEMLVTSIIDLCRCAALLVDPRLSVIPAPLIARQAALQQAMNAWRDACTASLKTVFASLSIYEQLGLRSLRLYHTMATVMLGTCLAHHRELSFDAFTPAFAGVLAQVEDVWRIVGYGPDGESRPHRDLCGLGPSFSIEGGVFPVLLYVAFKCRDRLLRRRARDLLAKCPHTEGMWTGPLISRVADKVIALEEEGSDWCSDEAGDKDGGGTVPERARFHDVKVDLVLDGTSRLATLTCTRFRHEGYEDEEDAWEKTIHEVDLGND